MEGSPRASQLRRRSARERVAMVSNAGMAPSVRLKCHGSRISRSFRLTILVPAQLVITKSLRVHVVRA